MGPNKRQTITPREFPKEEGEEGEAAPSKSLAAEPSVEMEPSLEPDQKDEDVLHWMARCKELETTQFRQLHENQRLLRKEKDFHAEASPRATPSLHCSPRGLAGRCCA